MAVHTLRIDSTSPHVVLELRSAATWVRGPGRVLSFHAGHGGASDAHLEVDDRVLRFGRSGAADAPMTLHIQVATSDDRVTIVTQKGAAGALVVTSDADSQTDARQDAASVSGTMVVFLSPPGP